MLVVSTCDAGRLGRPYSTLTGPISGCEKSIARVQYTRPSHRLVQARYTPTTAVTGNVTQALLTESRGERCVHSERILEIDRDLMPDVIDVLHHRRERRQLKCYEKWTTEKPQYECRPQRRWMMRNERPELQPK
jgi:hypothetical protein